MVNDHLEKTFLRRYKLLGGGFVTIQEGNSRGSKITFEDEMTDVEGILPEEKVQRLVKRKIRSLLH